MRTCRAPPFTALKRRVYRVNEREAQLALGFGNGTSDDVLRAEIGQCVAEAPAHSRVVLFERAGG